MFLNAFAPYSFRKFNTTDTDTGTAWFAVLQRDGKDAAKVSDPGDGGPLSVDFVTPVATVDFQDFVCNLPADAQSFLQLKPNAGEPTVESVLVAMADLARTTQRLKARCKRATVYVTTTMPAGEVGVLKVQFTPKVKAALERQYGERLVAVLNEVL